MKRRDIVEHTEESSGSRSSAPEQDEAGRREPLPIAPPVSPQGLGVPILLPDKQVLSVKSRRECIEHERSAYNGKERT